MQEWQSRVVENCVCCKYRLLRRKLCFQEYLIYIPSTLRQRVLKFRLSNHKLQIQQRRSLGFPRDERICTICDSGEVGDEFHYLLNCFNENVKRNRTKYVDKYNTRHPNVSKYCSIMNMTAKSKNMLSLLDLLVVFFGYFDQTNSKHSDQKKIFLFCALCFSHL